MCSPLCDYVVNFSEEESPLNSQKLLEYLDRINLFVVPLDNQRIWYRYHHLFSEAVRHRLQKTAADQVPLLHRRASQWYEAEEDYDLALKHALAAEDLDRAARIVENNAIQLLMHSNLTVLKKWLDSLPPELIHARPELYINQAWIHLLIGKVEDVNWYVNNANQLLSSLADQETSERINVLGNINVIKSHLALKDGKLVDAITLTEKALEYINKGSPLHGHVAVIQAQVAYLNDDLPTADQSFREAVQIAKDCDHMFMAVEAAIWLGHIKTPQGNLHEAEKFFRDALRLAEVGDNSILPIAGSAYIGLALVERERNNLAAAEKLLTDGYDLCNLFGNLQSWHIAIAYVKNAQGKFNKAIENLQFAENLSKGSDVIFDHLKIDHGRVRLWFLPTGEMFEEAKQWAENCDLKATDEPSFSRKNEYTLFARVLFSQGEVGEAKDLLDRLQENAEVGDRKGDLIEILVLKALALQKQQNSEEAITIIEKALTLAEPEGFIRIFIDEGQAIKTLLKRMSVKEKRLKEYIRKLLDAFENKELPASSTQPLIEPLSDRELEVLRMLAKGLTNKEVATRLFLSPNTVKVHARNIYQKLNTTNRTQATARARELGILPDD
jgi:LuxR family maltose regulon positive regulatory protein